jgi:hypothetical protein
MDMPPSPAKGADMREGTWLKLEEDVRRASGVQLPRVRHVFYSLSHFLCLCNLIQRRTEIMPFDKPLHNLLEQPFGPYLEETILSDKCKFMASKRLLLGDFQLAYNDEPTG